MNKWEKWLTNGEFQKLFDELMEKQYCYTIDKFSKDFSRAGSAMKFAYLQYVISRDEKIELHILVCEFLMFTDTFFFDIYPVIGWHLKRALEISPDNINVLQWITCTFNGHPDSPFSEYDLKEFSNRLEQLTSR